MKLTILGSNSANPAHGRFLTAQVLEIGKELILIDCGEATQMQMQKYSIRRSRVNRIFISHLHGDHYYGLIGLITSYALMQRTEPLHIYGPKEIDTVINVQLKASDSRIPFDIIFHIVDKNEIICKTNSFSVKSFAVQHRIPTYGYKFDEIKLLRKINPEACSTYEIPYSYYSALQNGEDYTRKDGTVIKNSELTFEGDVAKSYAYCADTKYTEDFLHEINDVHTLYHETTFLKDQEERAAQFNHSTTHQAATIAKKANAKQLIIGHFSGRYSDIEPFEAECREIFENSFLAIEGKTFEW